MPLDNSTYLPVKRLGIQAYNFVERPTATFRLPKPFNQLFIFLWYLSAHVLWPAWE